MDTETSEIVEISGPITMEHNPVVVFLSSKSPSSRYTYGLDLKGIADLLGAPDPLLCNWSALRFQHTQAIRTMLMENVSPRTGKLLAPVTINRILCALRGVLKAAWRLEQMSSEDYHRAVDIDSVIGETLPAGRELNDGEIANLLDVCVADISPAGTRDAAIIALLYTCGLRRGEVTALDLADYDQSDGVLLVSGKRRKERTAYLVNEAAQAMGDWLEIRSDRPGPLFWPIYYGRLIYKRMAYQTIYDMLVKRGKQAGVMNFSPHDMRRTFVSHLLGAGVDITTVSKMAGHSSVTTTARYDRRPEGIKREAAELLHVPYRGRRG